MQSTCQPILLTAVSGVKGKHRYIGRSLATVIYDKI